MAQWIKAGTGNDRSYSTTASIVEAGQAVGFQAGIKPVEETIQRKNRAVTTGFQIDVDNGIVGIKMLFNPFFTFSTVVLDIRARRAKAASLNRCPSTGTAYCTSAM